MPQGPKATSSRWSRKALHGRLDVVVDPDRGQHSIRGAFMDDDPGLRRQVMPPPTQTVVLEGAAGPVVGHGALLQSEPTAGAEVAAEKCPQLTDAAVDG